MARLGVITSQGWGKLTRVTPTTQKFTHEHVHHVLVEVKTLRLIGSRGRRYGCRIAFMLDVVSLRLSGYHGRSQHSDSLSSSQIVT